MEILEVVSRLDRGALTHDAIACLIAERDNHRSRQAALEVIIVGHFAKQGLTPEEISDRINRMIESIMQTDGYRLRIKELQNLSYQDVAS